MSRRIMQVCVLAVALLGGRVGGADEIAPRVVTVFLKDGGRLVGTIVAEDDAAITLRISSGQELKLLRESITSLDLGPPANGGTRPDRTDPNDTRLMFAPTGRPLGKGDGYVSNHYVVFPGFAYGLTNNLSLGGGFSTIPGVGLNEQVFYVSTQWGGRLSEKAAFSFGGLYAGGVEEVGDAAVLFGVTALGRPERSLTLGAGLALTREQEATFDPRGRYQGSRERWRSDPVLMVGGTARIARQISLVAESWLFPREPLSQQPFGLALRFFGDRLSVDAGFVFVPELLDKGFPIPWLSFSYHFGPSRGSAKRAASVMPAALRRGR